jgi:mono/diheme cytochrome c family protein
MQCFTCHANGDNLINPAKPIKGTNFLAKYPEDAQIAQLIRRGVPGTAMPAYAKERMSDDQLYALIAYVRSLTPPPQ